MVLADAIDVESQLIGELDLFHEVAEPLAELIVRPVRGSAVVSANV